MHIEHFVTWIQEAFAGVHEHIDHLGRMIMGADEDLKGAVAALVAEDGIVLAVVTDLASKAATSTDGTVPAADVTNAVSTINSEIARVQGALAAADASVAVPTDSGSTGAPSTEATPAPDASSGSAPTDTGDVTATPGTGSTDASQAAPDAGSTPTS